MYSTRAVALFLSLCCAFGVAAQFPLTNTRYGAQSGSPLLATNGSDFFLFWQRPESIYVSRANSGALPGQPALDTNGGVRYDVIRTGTQFLVAATRRNDDGSFSIAGRLLDANGQPAGAPFVIVDSGRDPRLAFNGTNILMVYRNSSNGISALPLDKSGQAMAPPMTVLVPMVETYSVASNGSGFLIVTAAADHMYAVPAGISGVALTPAYTVRNIGADTTFGALALIPNSNGEYVAIFRDWYSVIRSMKFTNDGSSITFEGTWIDTEYSRGPISIAPFGDGLAVASFSYDRRAVRLLRVDRNGAVTAQTFSSPAGTTDVAVTTAPGKMLVAWSDSAGAILLDSDDEVEVGRFGAADQVLELMTSSSDGVFVVWSEHSGGRTTWRAGVRTPAGDWKEIALPGDAKPLAAAAGGGQFLIVVPRGETIYGRYEEFAALRWTADLEPIGSEIPIRNTFFGNLLAAGWTGSAFVIAGASFSDESQFAAALLSPAGALGVPKVFDSHYYTKGVSPLMLIRNPTLTAGGNGFVLAVQARTPNCFPEDCENLYFDQVRALRVRSDLSDGEMFVVASHRRHVTSLGRVAWDGRGFVVPWEDSTGRHSRRIPAEGAIEEEAPLPADAPLADRNTVPLGSGFASVRSATQSAAPYFGASRLLMTIRDVALPPLPDAPHLSAGLTADGRAVLTWSAPPQETNGYRVEMRGPSGAWIEVEQWIPANSARLLSIRVESPASFRVRAWNDAGVGAYSNEATPAAGKRRSAR